MSPNLYPEQAQYCLRPFYRKIPYKVAWRVSISELLRELRKDLIFYEESGGGVTFSGGEPLIQPEFLHQLLLACKKENIHTAVDTSGYADWKTFQNILPDVDIFLFDIKILDPDRHKKFVGVSNKKILDNLDRLLQLGSRVIIRIPLIPGITDTETNLQQIADFLKKYEEIERIDLLPYNMMGEDKYKKLNQKQNMVRLHHQSDYELKQIQSIFVPYGFEVNIGG
ncbi:MAG: glycyl-radical enzyme activating protein [bacterium]|nr:MAG: glycyl-radical enzyme activating protein [bacterium]